MKTQLFFTVCYLCMFSVFISHAQPVSFNSKGIGGGGALFAPSVNPANNNEYFVACDMGELFHTTDFGATYSQVHFSQLIGGHNSKVCYTATSGLLYCINYANNKVVPVKSTDDGKTWTALGGNPDESEETFTIHADYATSDRVIISYYDAIYFSGDGGATFKKIHTAATGSGNVVAGVFFDGTNIYVGTNDGVLVSTNGGVDFTTAALTGIPSTERIWSFAGAKTGGTVRFFCLTGNAADVYVGLVGSDYQDFMKGIYSVDYGTGNWTPKMTGITIGTDYPMFVGMAANDISTVYLAGSNSNSEPIIMKTINGGTNWVNTFKTGNNENIHTGWSGFGGDRGWSYGECPFAIAVAPNNSGTVIFGDLGFVHKTSTGGTIWQQAYIKSSGQHPLNTAIVPGQPYQSANLENTTCWQIHWINSTTMWSCFSDIRGIRSNDSGNSWAFNYTGHTANSSYRIVQHPSNNTLFMACSNIHDIYQSTYLQDTKLDANDPNGKIMYSTDNGASWQNLHIFNHPVFWITLDPSNPDKAYASVIHYNGGNGTGGIYVCNDLQKLGSSTWTLLPNPPRTEKHPASIVVLKDGKMVCTYSGRRTTAFTASSGVFIYDPANNGWSDVSDPGMLYWTKDIVLDPTDAQQNTWYVCVFSGWGGAPNGLGGLYKTTNRGGNWKRITDPSLINSVTSCTFNPSDPDQLFMTTETQGLWMSTDIHAANPKFSAVNTYPFQQPERVFFNPYNTKEMWVSSFGNGMKMGTLTTTGILIAADKTEKFVFPNPSSGIVHLSNESANAIMVFDLPGKLVTTIPIQEGANELNLSFLPSGIYFLNWENKKAKLVINR